MSETTDPQSKVAEAKAQSPLTCFIATPIGEENSEIRLKMDGVIEAVIIPVLKEFHFEEINIIIPHRMKNMGSITYKVIEHLLNADLVIANLTGPIPNPNVMYELAVRHFAQKPVVTIAEFGTKLPFDIQEDRTEFYSDDMKGVVKFIPNFKAAVRSALETDLKEINNPIFRSITLSKFIENVGKMERAMVEKLAEQVINNASSANQFINQVIRSSPESVQLKMPVNMGGLGKILGMSVIPSGDEYTEERLAAELNVFGYQYTIHRDRSPISGFLFNVDIHDVNRSGWDMIKDSLRTSGWNVP